MRLIDADALIPLIKMGECNMYDEYCQGRNGGIEFAVNQVKQMPTIEERKTGRWIHKGGGSFICSDCGEMVGLNTYRSERAGEIFRYCPHCGAYMGGELDDSV